MEKTGCAIERMAVHLIVPDPVTGKHLTGCFTESADLKKYDAKQSGHS